VSTLLVGFVCSIAQLHGATARADSHPRAQPAAKADAPPPPFAEPTSAPAPTIAKPAAAAPSPTLRQPLSPSQPGQLAPGPGPLPPNAFEANQGPFAFVPNAGITVDLRADNNNVGISRTFGGQTIPICSAPCRRTLDRNQTYVIEGPGVRPTSQFILPDDRDQVTLTVEAGSRSRFATGVALLVGGGATAYIGLILAEMGLASSALSSIDSNNSQDNRGNTLTTVGLVMVGVGLPAMVYGIYTAVTTHTTVTSSTGAHFTEHRAVPQKRPRFALTARGIEF